MDNHEDFGIKDRRCQECDNYGAYLVRSELSADDLYLCYECDHQEVLEDSCYE